MQAANASLPCQPQVPAAFSPQDARWKQAYCGFDSQVVNTGAAAHTWPEQPVTMHGFGTGSFFWQVPPQPGQPPEPGRHGMK